MNYRGKRFYGLHGGATGWLIGQIASKFPRIIVICQDRKSQERLKDDVSFFSNHVPILSLTGWDTLPFEEVSPDIETSATRLSTLLSLETVQSYITLVSPEALLQRSLAKSFISKLIFSLSVGQTIARDELVKHLVAGGFSVAGSVNQVGDFSVRGGVVDCWPGGRKSPLRIEFEDITICSIRTFDVETQRSVHTISNVMIFPVRERIDYSKDSPFHPRLDDAIQKLKAAGKELETPPREIARCMAALRTGALLPGAELIQLITEANTDSFFDFCPKDAVFVLQDEIGITQLLDEESDHIESRYLRMRAEHRLIPKQENHFLQGKEVVKKLVSLKPTYVDSLASLADVSDEKSAVNLLTRSNLEFATRIKSSRTLEEGEPTLKRELDLFRNKGNVIAFCIGSEGRSKRLQNLLERIDIAAPIAFYSANEWLNNRLKPPVVILSGQLSDGFSLPSEKTIFIAEHEIFPERSQRKQKKATFNLKKILQSLAKLSEGDFVVHTDYGIGLYKGLKHFEVEGGQGDFLFIQYADSVLYVPIQNINRIQKFSAAEGQSPALDKLASTRWLKTKAKVRESVAALAGDLIRLYAARSVAKGWRFDPMGGSDEQFAETFPYDETADQMKAIEEVLDDMSQDRVMDRLICGDVGFGKTEVAIRAAFKATQHKRQVAVLVPTTILVEQHRKNFAQRFKEYDVSIESMSRFNSAADNRRILEGLKSGTVDIVLGTHRLLSKDVVFNDLGLVIIDEEHRFGVKQKEKLKAIKRSVDVLTLTATPIPRTLHMSLLGIRDISAIQTPPLDRRSIRTYVANHDQNLIRDAIIRELQRGGQAFYLHNRVQSIDTITAGLKDLVPEARFRFAHGQMTETQLETIMQDFIDRKFDVLVSTTIIESGIDIPNANTLIVDRADTFGLAQLYQIRGRVGRSTRQAYAYLLVPKTSTLSIDARRRLKALQSLDELGMGFNLAMQDLEIRGAGNLLGKEQSGNVLSVGFDLYTKILKEAVLNLKGEELDLSETIDPEVKLPTPTFIPEWYIPDISERLIMYQRMAGIETDLDTEELRAECFDRFGPIPPEVFALLSLMRLRAVLRSYGSPKLEIINKGLVLSLSKRSPVRLEKIIALTTKSPQTFLFGKNLGLTVRLAHPDRNHPDDIYPIVTELLERIS